MKKSNNRKLQFARRIFNVVFVTALLTAKQSLRVLEFENLSPCVKNILQFTVEMQRGMGSSYPNFKL